MGNDSNWIGTVCSLGGDMDACPRKHNTLVGGFFNSPKIKWTGYTHINIKHYDEWQDYLNALSTARILVTGYHHEVIAACKLKIPFIAYRGSTDKVLGIIKRAGADIKVAQTPDELKANLNEPINVDEYTKLFSYLEQQAPFTLEDIGIYG